MADSPDADSKTEAPSAKRRADARARGEVWQSRELDTALGILGGVAWLALAGRGLFEACAALVARGLSIGAARTLDPGALLAPLAPPLTAFAAVMVVAAVAGPLLLGPHWSGGALAPKPSRLDPLAGLRRLAGLQGPGELGKALVKAALVGGAGWFALSDVAGLAALAAAPPLAAAARLGSLALHLLVVLSGALLAVAALDVPWQRSRWLAKLRMTKQEVRDEAREADGNPQVRAAQRRLARANARRALRPAMAEATVVTVNPTEFAVALRYVPGRDAAPVIVARGRDLIAAAIRDLAAERRVPVLRYPQLTRAIFFTGSVGSAIRDDLYAPVAAVLAFVLSVDADVKTGEAERHQPDIVVPRAARFDAFGRAEA